MERNFRPILPLIASSSTRLEAPSSSQDLESPSKKRRRTTKVACNECRASKVACDGDRPSCRRCARTRKQCVYLSNNQEESLREAKARQLEEAQSGRRQYEDLIDRLRSGSELEAYAVLQELRYGSSAANFASQNGYDPSVIPSTFTANVASLMEPVSSVKSALGGAGPLPSTIQPYQRIHGSAGNKRPSETTEELLDQNKSASLELLEVMIKSDAELSQRVLQQLRMKSSPSSILGSIKGYETSTIRISQHETARSITPPIQSKQELQLMVRYPNAYPRLDPIDLVATKAFLTTSFPLSVDLEPIELDSSAKAPPFPSRPTTSSNLLPEATSTEGGTAVEQPIDPGPSKPPTLFDSRLVDLNISFWTTVPIASTLAAEILSSYLEVDHPVCGLFDSTAFITGLLQNDIDLCSAFQVNSLLAFAAQGYSAKSSVVSTYAHQFAEEAERLWRGERGSDCPANIVGLYSMFQYYAKCWEEEPCRLFYQDLREMVRRMRLWGVADRISLEDLASAPNKARDATAYAAWATFNLLTRESVYWWGDAPEYPPILPIPGDILSTVDRGNARAPAIPLVSYMGQTFPAFCRFWTVVAEILLVYHAEDAQVKVPLAFALSKYQRLLSVAESLPLLMARTDKAKDHVVIFHIWLHVIILDIFRPFIADPKQHGLSQWTPSASDPEAIFSASVKQLKHLIHLYDATHTSVYHSIYWHVALMTVTNAAVKNPSDPEWNIYLLLCLYHYSRLNICYSVAGTITQGLLAIAVDRGAIKFQQAASYMDMFNLNGQRKTGQKVQSGFVVDLDLALTDKDAAFAETLADKFDQLTMFSDLTEGVV